MQGRTSHGGAQQVCGTVSDYLHYIVACPSGTTCTPRPYLKKLLHKKSTVSNLKFLTEIRESGSEGGRTTIETVAMKPFFLSIKTSFWSTKTWFWSTTNAVWATRTSFWPIGTALLQRKPPSGQPKRRSDRPQTQTLLETEWM